MVIGEYIKHPAKSQAHSSPEPWAVVFGAGWAVESFTSYCHKARRRQWLPTPVLLPGKSHGRRSLEGCSLWGR